MCTVYPMSGWARLRVVVITTLWLTSWIVVGFVSTPSVVGVVTGLGVGMVAGVSLLFVGWLVYRVYLWVKEGFER